MVRTLALPPRAFAIGSTRMLVLVPAVPEPTFQLWDRTAGVPIGPEVPAPTTPALRCVGDRCFAVLLDHGLFILRFDPRDGRVERERLAERALSFSALAEGTTTWIAWQTPGPTELVALDASGQAGAALHVSVTGAPILLAGDGDTFVALQLGGHVRVQPIGRDAAPTDVAAAIRSGDASALAIARDGFLVAAKHSGGGEAVFAAFGRHAEPAVTLVMRDRDFVLPLVSPRHAAALIVTPGELHAELVSLRGPCR
jgi:hypothetical protein